MFFFVVGVPAGTLLRKKHLQNPRIDTALPRLSEVGLWGWSRIICLVFSTVSLGADIRIKHLQILGEAMLLSWEGLFLGLNKVEEYFQLFFVFVLRGFLARKFAIWELGEYAV